MQAPTGYSSSQSVAADGGQLFRDQWGQKDLTVMCQDFSRFHQDGMGSFSTGIVKGFPRQLDCGHGLLVLEGSRMPLALRVVGPDPIEDRDGILMVVSEDGEQFIDNRWSVRSGPAFSINSPR